MNNTPDYKILMHRDAYEKASAYLADLADESCRMGTYLSRKISGRNLGNLSAEEFLELLVNTKFPQIFAESAVCGDGSDWNNTELSILGDISIGVPVMVYDNGSHYHPVIHKNPFDAHLIYTPGALLRNDRGKPAADAKEVVENGEINYQGYRSLYERRLLPAFLYANKVAGACGRKALITIPGLGCGQFAGKFKGQMGPILCKALIDITEKHVSTLPHIRAIYFDPYSACENERREIEQISFLVRPLTKGNEVKSQLCPVDAYEDVPGEFVECDLFSVVAWDHVSWPGNDFFGGSRGTDDGVKAAATNSMQVMTGVKGEYNRQSNKYEPPAHYRTWSDVVSTGGLSLRVAGNLVVALETSEECSDNAAGLVDEVVPSFDEIGWTEGYREDYTISEDEALPDHLATQLDFIKGCLFGGAIGDALGAPVEMKSREEILATFGPDGVTQFEKYHGGYGKITDDTQMSLFTLEGIIRCRMRACIRGMVNPPGMFFWAYTRWARTQGAKVKGFDESYNNWDGWLITNKELHERRGPGKTCLSALLDMDVRGRVEKKINNSKGCGGVMRAASAGFFDVSPGAFELGCDLAAVTHGHPSGYLSGGFLAELIAKIRDGRSLLEAIFLALIELKNHIGHEEITEAVYKAVEYATNPKYQEKPYELIEKIGQGWVAEEALAIGIFCALKSEDFHDGVLMAVNHGGDSDSTGAITGNILGAICGFEGIFEPWRNQIEFKEIMNEMAEDAVAIFNSDSEQVTKWEQKYPGC